MENEVITVELGFPTNPDMLWQLSKGVIDGIPNLSRRVRKHKALDAYRFSDVDDEDLESLCDTLKDFEETINSIRWMIHRAIENKEVDACR